MKRAQVITRADNIRNKYGFSLDSVMRLRHRKPGKALLEREL